MSGDKKIRLVPSARDRAGLAGFANGQDTLFNKRICNFDEFLDLFKGVYALHTDFLVLGIISSIDPLSECGRQNL